MQSKRPYCFLKQQMPFLQVLATPGQQANDFGLHRVQDHPRPTRSQIGQSLDSSAAPGMFNP
jgi:hypothetical protein